jgi:hypothetical protein
MNKAGLPERIFCNFDLLELQEDAVGAARRACIAVPPTTLGHLRFTTRGDATLSIGVASASAHQPVRAARLCPTHVLRVRQCRQEASDNF